MLLNYKRYLGLFLFVTNLAHAGSISVGSGGAPTYKPAVANVAALPAIGNTPGDARVVLSPISFYGWDGASWNDLGSGGGGGAVTSVFGRVGVVVSANGDYIASQITNTPAGSIAAVQVQAAINELDSEKQSLLVNSAGLAAALSDETGSGLSVFATSPALAGNPTAPTQAANNNSTRIATTAYADASSAAAAAASIVQTILNGDTTHASSSDALFDALALKQDLLVNSAGLAAALSDETGTGFSVFSASPALTGVPTAPTAATTTSTAQIATTAFVQQEIGAIDYPVDSVHGRTGAVVSANGDYTASQVTNVAAGNIAAVQVQAAINELDSEKQALLVNSAGLASALSDESGTGLAVFNDSPALAGNPTAPTQAPADNSTKIATTAYADAAAAASVPSGTANTFAGFDGAGDLYTIPGFGINTTTGGENASLVYVPANAAGTQNMHTLNSEIDDQANITGTSVNNFVSDLHAGRLTPLFGLDGAITGITSSVSAENAGAYGTFKNINMGLNLGDGVGGSGQVAYSIQANDFVNTGFVLDEYRFLTAGVQIDGSLDDEYDIFFQSNGDVVDSYSGISLSKNGDVGGNFYGYNFDYNGALTSGMTGFRMNLQGTSDGQVHMLNFGSSMAIDDNLLMANFNNTGDITGQFNGLQIDSSGDMASGSLISASSSGLVAGHLNGLAINTSGNSDSEIGVSVIQSGDVTTSRTGVDVNIQGDGVDSYGVNIGVNGAYTGFIQGLKVDVGSATSPNRKVAANFSGGSLMAGGTFSTVSNYPSLLDFANVIAPTFTVAGGTPITGTDFLGTNMAAVGVFDDDFGTSAFGLGFVSVGFVGQTSIANGKTVSNVAGAVGGASVPASSGTGTLSRYDSFKGFGIVSGGGTITVTDSAVFAVDPLFDTSFGTNKYGVYVNSAVADNWFKKSVSIGASSSQAAAGIGLEVNDGDVHFAEDLTVDGVADLGDGSVAVTQPALDNSTLIATTAYVDAAVGAGGVVSSVFGRTGAVVSANGDYTASQVTNVAAGNIAAVTVQAAINELDSEKQSLLVNSAGLLGALSDETGTGFAVFSISPALTGSPTAPTQTALDSSTKIATTAYADASSAAASLAIIASSIVNGDLTHAPDGNSIFDALALKQDLLVNSAGLAAALSDETGTGLAVFDTSPALAGNPTAPTQAAGNNSTRLATTAFVQAALVTSVVDGGNAAYTILASDGHVRSGTALTANRTYTLPACVANIGEKHVIKNLPAQTFNIILAADGTDVIDGVASKALLPGDSIPVVCAASGVWDIQ